MSDPHDEPLVTGEDRADELEAAWFERLLDVPDADCVPAAYEPLAAVLLTLRAPGNEDVSGEAAAVTMFRSCQAGVTWVGINRTRTAKALTVAAAVTLATVTGAAAAGRLPADIQDMTSHLLDKVGIHIPAADRTDDQDAPNSDWQPAAGLDPVTASPASSGSRRESPTRHGPATTELAQTSATLATAGPPPAADAPAAATTTIAATPAGTDATTADAAARAPQPVEARPAATSAQDPDANPAAAPTASPPITPPANDHASPPAGPPITPPANDHASPPAGPPITPPANDHASPPAGPPITPPANDHASPPAGPPITPPANDYASPPAAALGSSEA